MSYSKQTWVDEGQQGATPIDSTRLNHIEDGIVAEETARATADSSEATARATADSSEAVTRAAADTALGARIAPFEALGNLTGAGVGPIGTGDAFRFDSTRLSAFKTALTTVTASPVDIIHVGDSITEGDTVTLAQRWQDLLTASLRATYPSGVAGGAGFAPAQYIGTTLVDVHTYTGTHSLSVPLGLGQRAQRISSSGTVSRTFTGTGVDFFYTTGSTGAATVTPTIDGVAQAPFSTTTTDTMGGNVYSVRGLAAGSHTVSLATSANYLYFEGSTVYNGDEAKGVRQWDAGHAGWRSQDFVEVTTSSYMAYRTIVPDLVTINLGTNDWGLGSNVATGANRQARVSPKIFERNLRDIISGIRGNVTSDPSIILFEPGMRGTPPTPAVQGRWVDYIQAIRRVAREDGRITLFDVAAVIGDQSGTNALVQSDKTHPTPTGHAAINTALVSLIQAA
jgi:lysophospholipase L1-like esterase